MKMKGTLVASILFLILGIFVIDNVVFTMEQWNNKCFCITNSRAQEFCDVMCANDGGCAQAFKDSYGKCRDGNCEASVWAFCKNMDEVGDDPIGGILLVPNCLDCIGI